MKMLLIAAAFALGGAAVAQDQPAAEAAPAEAEPPGAAEQLPPPSVPAGATVVFKPSVPVAQAYPAPAPKAEYPWCKRGMTDGCKQRHDPGNGQSPR